MMRVMKFQSLFRCRVCRSFAGGEVAEVEKAAKVAEVVEVGLLKSLRNNLGGKVAEV